MAFPFRSEFCFRATNILRQVKRHCFLWLRLCCSAEQDHRAIKRRVTASQGFRSFHGAWGTIQGYEGVHMIPKGQARWVPQRAVVALRPFLKYTLRIHDSLTPP